MLRFTVRFDRYTQDNQDDDIANDAFPYIPDPVRRLLEQMRAELGENKKLAGLWDTYFHRVVNDNLFCVWIGFDWYGEGVDFCRVLQDTYDTHGMSGFYEILDVVGDGLPTVSTGRELLKNWVHQANQPKDIPAIFELDEDGEATGSLNYYCSSACYEQGKDDHSFERCSHSTTPRDALCEGSQCYHCGKQL